MVRPTRTPTNRPTERPAYLALGLALGALLAFGGMFTGAVGPTVAMDPLPSAAGFTLSLTATPVGGATPDLVDFQAVLDPNSTFAEFTWSFGDGQRFSENATGVSHPTHTYPTPATYLATVFANASSGSVEQSIAVVVPAQNLSVAIGAYPGTGGPPIPVTFVAQISGGTGTFASIVWTFGDGSTGMGDTLVHNYSIAGVYEVTVQVADARGDRANASLEVTVGPSTGGGGATPSWWAPPMIWYLATVGLVGVFAALAVGYWWTRVRPTSFESDSQGVLFERAASEVLAPDGAEVESGRAAAAASVDDATPSDAPLPVGPTDEPRRVTEQVLVHLHRNGRNSAGELPMAATQQGMVRGLRVTQNSLSKVLTRLVAAGVVRVETRHVPGVARRVKAYSLTARGEAVAKNLLRAGGAPRPPRGRPPSDVDPSGGSP